MKAAVGKGCPSARRRPAVFLLVCAWTTVFPFRAGAVNFGFLDRISSPRIGAMAGSWGALTGDVNGMFFNPAGLAFVDCHQAAFSYGEYLADLRGGMIGAVLSSSNRGNLGMGLVYFDYGGFQERDRYGSLTGREFGATEMILAASYSRLVREDVALGVNAKLLYSKLDRYYMLAVAVDLGVLYRPPSLRGISVGLALLNLGYNSDPYISIKEKLPLHVKLGISYGIGFLPMIVNISTNHPVGAAGHASGLSFSAGSELSLFDLVHLRIGYDRRIAEDVTAAFESATAGFSCGAGLSLEGNILDYSVSDYGALGAVHRFGVSFHFGERNGRKR